MIVHSCRDVLGRLAWLAWAAHASALPASDSSELAPLGKVEIRETTEKRFPDGKVTIHRIKDPGLPDLGRSQTAASIEAEASVGDSQVSVEPPEQTVQAVHRSMAATVIDGWATLLQWRHEGTDYRAWSNANWAYLGGFTSCEGSGKIFVSFLALDEVSSIDLPADSPYRIPTGFAAEPGTYQLIQGDPANVSALEAVEALHALYCRDYERLKAAHERRLQNQVEPSTHSSPSEDITLHYWKVQPEEVKP